MTYTRTQHMLEGTLTAVGLFSFMFFGAYLAKQQELYTTQVAAAFLSEIDVEESAIEARAAIVYDARTGDVLFEKNADESLPLASLTKLMAAEAILADNSDATRVFITPQDLAPEGDSGLRVGEEWSLRDLLTFALVASSNDAVAAAASLDSGIVGSMNAAAAALGLSQMKFLNPTGLDLDPELAGAYGSARDVAFLAADFHKKYPTLFAYTAHPQTTIELQDRTVLASTTAAPILDIPGLVGAKTGYTDLAGGNLVAVIDIEIGRPLVIAILGSSREGRFTDARTLIEAARAMLAED